MVDAKLGGRKPVKSSSPVVLADGSAVKKKRRAVVKTFFGCDKCRQRRIKCDLAKPSCNNCNKSDVKCPGYGVTLCWLSLPKFTQSGDLVVSSLAFKNENRSQQDIGSNEGFRRRLVGFVKWEKGTSNKPYDTYEDIDQDLMILDNSQADEHVEKLGKTKILGPFGVFQNKSPKLPTSENSAPTISNEHLWLSNELRDDALLTAAALNGDSHLLDFMTSNNISPQVLNTGSHTPVASGNGNGITGSHGTPPPMGPHTPHAAPSNTITNPSDFLNLLFHKNQTQAKPTSTVSTPGSVASPHAASSAGPVATSDLHLDLLSHSDILIDPTNQHLYYSNYNNYFYDNPYKLNENLEIHLHASSKPNKLHESSTDLVEGQNPHVTTMPSSIMNIVQSPLQPKLGFHLLTPSATSVGMPTSALQIQPLTRYLLNHYVNHVADLMTVLPLTESPWKTIYFPRALMAIGELGALGKTSTAKNALLNALLAVSAFNLQSKFPKNSDSMKFYLNLGIRLRNQASLFVRKLLGSSSDMSQQDIESCLKNEKYKDVLCAVMSMISVDLVWGTMQDTNFYIRWCGRVISTKMQHKKKLSPKARVLHRIYSSLKIIQDSTCLSIDNIKHDYRLIDENGYDVNGENFVKSDKKNTEDKNPSSGRHNTTPLFINKKLINTKHHNENFATDALYGLPNSLITLFAETVRLLRHKLYNKHVAEQEDQAYVQAVAQLGLLLDHWQLDWKLYAVVDDEKKFYSSMHQVTFHHIMSFYYALTIYFNRLIKDQHPSTLQDKVKVTLEHLNSIQRLISKENVGIIPLFWQGFIAGCEAVTPDVQVGYKKWGADIAQYLGSYWGARQIMLEVWRRKRLHLAKDDWVGVITDWEMNLMLN
ncbi:hypothetical protein CANTEDRAFT_94289 [Yamadazyma tenuis ATCC 10573]|uniref:Zn(2)-C6 fungal-type domain-containing protein n=1 Tax=Candida tenuis (strain ATCC 10573 / BCRC 21748 / CBS 615 / JCM 9827 / NBRC 10315 / NRRL Y-1498 / VKM Y-70) TaxID=590646 RepID=G3BA86_CANTC|nr:uncharacterized protein CANTEDRAFT_94289 [Yamadazyma tenuis ATCC 10573]EGV61382.1 hypothetical protein CANTEDRAFT_94289 [Yamadazyma tenuis ATCC 10573]